MPQVLELILDRDGERVLLRSPEVGFFTRALPSGALLAPHVPAGVLHSLGRRFDLLVPAGVAGRVVNAPPEPVLAPVAYGTVLYELAPLEAAISVAARAPDSSEGSAGALVFRAPHSGRFWQRPAPNDPPFVRAGELLEDGRTLGLIEVMKTFTHVVYRAGTELPARARVVRLLVADGEEVEEGGALVDLQPEP